MCQIDYITVQELTDEQLRGLGLAYGDLVALRIHVRSTLGSSSTSRSSADSPGTQLLQRLHDRLNTYTTATTTAGSRSKRMKMNKLAQKDTRRVEVGWLHKDIGHKAYKQVRAAKGGGTRHLVVPVHETVESLLETAIALFFPDGVSLKGPREDYEFTMLNFDQTELHRCTIGALYEVKKVKILRVYMATTPCSTNTEAHTATVPTSSAVLEDQASQPHDKYMSYVLNKLLILVTTDIYRIVRMGVSACERDTVGKMVRCRSHTAQCQ